jgi:hypothetical protein
MPKTELCQNALAGRLGKICAIGKGIGLSKEELQQNSPVPPSYDLEVVYMRDRQLKPYYNLQLSTNSQFTVSYSIHRIQQMLKH